MATLKSAASTGRGRAAAVAARVGAALLGGYAFVWGSVTLAIVLLVRGGMDYHEAHTLAMLLAFLVYLVAVCWAFAAARVLRVWWVLVGGGGAMSALAAWLGQGA